MEENRIIISERCLESAKAYKGYVKTHVLIMKVVMLRMKDRESDMANEFLLFIETGEEYNSRHLSMILFN